MPHHRIDTTPSPQRSEAKMNETLRLGTISGIRVGVNWSVLVIFTLLLVVLSVGNLPVLAPDRSPLAYWLAGTGAAVVFFLSLLAHELAHAIVARREGVEVEGITLWLFGGVARLSGEPPTPAADLRVAGVGPLVSIVLGMGFGALALAAAWAEADTLLVGVLMWLALINVALAVFNLVPAAPLDGGRILRALLWWRGGDRSRAAVTAARAGRGFGFLLIALGVTSLLFFPGVGMIWLALIGWFIASAASAEEQHTRVQDSLRGLAVVDVMTGEPLTVRSDLTVAQLLDDYVLRHRHSAYPVVDAWGRPQGLVTLDRIRGVDVDQRGRVVVGDIAAGLDEVAAAAPQERLVEVLPRLSQGDRRILVIQDGVLVGIVTATDVTRALELSDLRPHRGTEGP
jgi:Zn-dependent protease/CBS domain-containing protein